MKLNSVGNEEIITLKIDENEHPIAYKAKLDELIACGMTEFIPGQDEKVEDVFHRADAAMYENKKQLKASR